MSHSRRKLHRIGILAVDALAAAVLVGAHFVVVGAGQVVIVDFDIPALGGGLLVHLGVGAGLAGGTVEHVAAGTLHVDGQLGVGAVLGGFELGFPLLDGGSGNGHGVASSTAGGAGRGAAAAAGHLHLQVFQTGGGDGEGAGTALFALHFTLSADGEQGGVAALELEIRIFALADLHIVAVVQVHGEVGSGLGFQVHIGAAQLEFLVAVVRMGVHILADFHLQALGGTGFGGLARGFAFVLLGEAGEQQGPVVFVFAALHVDTAYARMGEIRVGDAVKGGGVPLQSGFLSLGKTGSDALGGNLAGRKGFVLVDDGVEVGHIGAGMIEEHEQLASALDGGLFQIAGHDQRRQAFFLADFVDLLKHFPGPVLIGLGRDGDGEIAGFLAGGAGKGNGGKQQAAQKNQSSQALKEAIGGHGRSTP